MSENENGAAKPTVVTSVTCRDMPDAIYFDGTRFEHDTDYDMSGVAWMLVYEHEGARLVERAVRPDWLSYVGEYPYWIEDIHPDAWVTP